MHIYIYIHIYIYRNRLYIQTPLLGKQLDSTIQNISTLYD